MILCDLDGTLIDAQRDIAVAFQHAWGGVIDAAPPAEGAIAQHIGKPLAQMVRELGQALAPAVLESFLQRYRRAYASQASRYTQIYCGVRATLQALSHLTLGVVTTKAQDQAEMVLQKLDLAPFFRHIQGATPGLRLKPAPDTVFAALEALHCAPQQALMVGDTPADMLAGKAAGTSTCAVTYGFGAREELLRCAPDYVIDSFCDVVALVQGSGG